MIAFWALNEVRFTCFYRSGKKGERDGAKRLVNVKLRLNIENEMHAAR
jgi:hypothetical protein